mmetsp:Transcript_126598/g.300727  ORF Transcript_126598/g.300727 Transcript_126598/m.300727 type:complete len:226 (-) Transcript_126598:887-1564(-)
MRKFIIVGPFIAGGGNEQHSGLLCTLNCHSHCRRRSAASPRVARELRAHGHSIVQAFDGIGGTSATRSRQKLHGHEPNSLPSHSSHSNGVVAVACNGSCAVCSMHLIIHRISIIVGEIGPVNVVHDPIAIIIDAIVRDFVWIDPHLILEVRMRVVDPGVNHCNHNPLWGRCMSDSPSLCSIDVTVTVMMQPPKPVQGGIIRNNCVFAMCEGNVELFPIINLISVG